jgi:hypothetical protein
VGVGGGGAGPRDRGDQDGGDDREAGRDGGDGEGMGEVLRLRRLLVSAAPAALESTATPKAPPSSWNVVTMADRSPATSGPASASPAVNAVTKVAPIPRAATASPLTIPAGPVHSAAVALPMAASASPAAATAGAGTTVASRPAAWAPATTATATGRNARPTSSAP